MALAHYDRHMPFVDGSVAIEGVDLNVVLCETDVRHAGMLRRAEYDVAEVSLSSYLVARDQGLPFTAIPVFPRRLFSQSQMYRNLAAGIDSPQHLVGRRVGLSSYQTTLSVLAKGDLHDEYGVPWKEIRWVTAGGEMLEVDLPSDVRVETLPRGTDLGQLLAAGEIEAMMTPRPPSSFLARDPRVARLFSDPWKEELDYFRRNGYWPIMHIVVFKDDVLRRDGQLASAALDTFQRANQSCLRHYDDPNWSRQAWGRRSYEDERELLGKDPWANGLAANRANLERFIRYSHEQGLIRTPMAVESLFAESTLGT